MFRRTSDAHFALLPCFTDGISAEGTGCGSTRAVCEVTAFSGTARTAEIALLIPGDLRIPAEIRIAVAIIIPNVTIVVTPPTRTIEEITARA